MKKFFFFLFLITYIASLGEIGRVAIKVYEGGRWHNDLYLIAFNGYYLPLIADDLEVDDEVTYYSFNRAIYTVRLEATYYQVIESEER